MLHANVAEGVHRIEDAFTNWYLVEDGGRLTVVDTGVPSSWDSLQAALPELGRTAADIDAVVLTHAHFDHVGFAERARTELGVPVYVHDHDVPLSRHPSRYDSERHRALYLATQVQALPIVATLLKHRAFWPPALKEAVRYTDGVLPVPGSPEVVFSPGHTHGHSALLLADRGVLLAGDAIVMLDPYTAKKGPRMVARAATADVDRNVRSLDALASTGAQLVLTGHGEPWVDGIGEAAAQARQNGAA